MGKSGGNRGKLVEEDGKNIQLSTKVAKILQTWAPMFVLGSFLHHVLLPCGWSLPGVNRNPNVGRLARSCPTSSRRASPWTASSARDPGWP